VSKRKNQASLDQKKCLELVIEGFHPEHDALFVGRYFGQCPEIDRQVIVNDVDELGKLPNAGHRYWVEVTDFDNYDLIGKIAKEPPAATK
jgi:ribosomal protein S12 methylthiotransferase